MTSDRDDQTFVGLWKGQHTPETVFEPLALKARVQRARRMESWRHRLHVAATLGVLLYWSSRLLFFESRLPAVFPWLALAGYVVILVTTRPPAAPTRWKTFSLLHSAEPPPCLEFYRRELEAWNKGYRPRIGSAIAMVVLGISLFFVTGKQPEITHPMGIALVVFSVVWSLWLRSRAGVVQKELVSLAAYAAATIGLK